MIGPPLRREPAADGPSQRGAALLIVLWLTTLISGVVVAAGLTARSDLDQTRRWVDLAQARYAAEAAVAVGILTLFDPTPGRDPMVGRSLALDLAGVAATVSVREECGRIDLNTGWATLISGLFTNAAPRSGGAALAAAVLDWRDPDQRPRPGGAEDTDYRAAGLPHGARDGPFETLEELWQVLGMTPELFATTISDLTIDCLHAGVDPLAASADVLASLPNLNQSAVAAFVAAREDYLAGRLPQPPTLVGGEPYLEPSAAVAFSLVGAVTAPVPLRWEVIVVVRGDAERPVGIRAWRRPLADGVAR